MNKSIDKVIIVYAIAALILILLSSGVSKIFRIEPSILVFAIFCVFLSFPLFLFKKNTVLLIIKTLLLSAIAYGTFFLLFRDLRKLFPSSSYSINETVGYVSYYKYPYSFDFFFYLILVLIPIFVFFMLKHNDRKNR